MDDADNQAVLALSSSKPYVPSGIAPGVLHDIGNAITSLNINIQMIEKGATDDRKALEMSLLSAKEIEMLVKYYQAETNRSNRTVGNQIFNSADTVRKLLDSEMFQMNLLGIDLAAELCSTNLYGQRCLFNRIALNLLNNAKESIVVANKNIRSIIINSHVESGFYILEVSDNGTGIKKNLQSEIFNNYTSSKDESGHGVGLGIVNSAVKSFGGEIELESTYGLGSKFKVSLPLIH